MDSLSIVVRRAFENYSHKEQDVWHQPHCFCWRLGQLKLFTWFLQNLQVFHVRLGFHKCLLEPHNFCIVIPNSSSSALIKKK